MDIAQLVDALQKRRTELTNEAADAIDHDCLRDAEVCLRNAKDIDNSFEQVQDKLGACYDRRCG